MSNPNDNKDRSLEEIIAETMALKHAKEQGVAPQNKTTSTPHTTQHSSAPHSAGTQPQHHTSGAAHSGSTQHHSSGAQHSGSTNGHSSARPVIANGQPKSSQHHSGQKSSSAAGHSSKRPTSQNGKPHKSTQGTVKKTSNGTKPAQSGKNSKGTKKGKKKKMSKKKKLLIALAIVLGVIIILICVLVGIIYHYINKINIVPDTDSYEILDSINIDDDLTSGPDSPQEDIDAADDAIKKNLDNAVDVMKDKDVYNILLIGTDARDTSDRGRSDSMILVSINKKTDKIIMTSFLRDIYLSIPDVESTRLNHAYAYGGPDLLVKTIEENFKIEINKYVQVNFYSFESVVDAVGGVEIEVTDEEVPYINASLYETNEIEGRDYNSGTLSHGGTYKLNGAQALSYARIRYVGTDFGRSERQRTVLTKIFEKMKGMSVTKLSDLLDEILPKVTTNMQKDEIFSFVLNSATYLSYDLEQCRVPADDTWQYLTIRGMSVIGIDFAANIDYLRDNIYGN